jgi:hypothetical protein
MKLMSYNKYLAIVMCYKIDNVIETNKMIHMKTCTQIAFLARVKILLQQITKSMTNRA